MPADSKFFGSFPNCVMKEQTSTLLFFKFSKSLKLILRKGEMMRLRLISFSLHRAKVNEKFTFVAALALNPSQTLAMKMMRFLAATGSATLLVTL
jgi:hypothetical protein